MKDSVWPGCCSNTLTANFHFDNLSAAMLMEWLDSISHPAGILVPFNTHP